MNSVLDKKLSTEKLSEDLIDYIIKKIVREIQPEKIILFGSFAKGEINDASDLDLFIIKAGHKSNREIRREIEALLWGRRFPVDLIVRKPEEIELNVKAKNPFYLYHIFRDGKVLYEKR